MDKSTVSARRPDTEEVPLDQWIPFMAQFTQENRGAHARVDVLGPDVGYQLETENKPFDGVAPDTKDRERSVWISFGTTPADHFTHGVHQVKAVRSLPARAEAGAVLEIEAQDGVITILELSLPEAYELPPPSRQ